MPRQAWLLRLTDPLQDLEPQVRAVLFRELLATPGIVLVGMAGGARGADALGHHAGDLLLQAVARRLEAALRPGDRIFRLGGDEFTILAENLPAASVGALADRVIAAVGAEPFQLEGAGMARIGVSVGYACAPEDGAELAEAAPQGRRRALRLQGGGQGRAPAHDRPRGRGRTGGLRGVRRRPDAGRSGRLRRQVAAPSL